MLKWPQAFKPRATWCRDSQLSAWHFFVPRTCRLHHPLVKDRRRRRDNSQHRRRLCRARHRRPAGRQRPAHQRPLRRHRRLLGGRELGTNARRPVPRLGTPPRRRRAHFLAAARHRLRAGSDHRPRSQPAATLWNQVAFPYATNATEISITVPAPAGNAVYRLRKP